MKIEINISNKVFYAFLAIFVIIFAGAGAYATRDSGVWHSADDIEGGTMAGKLTIKNTVDDTGNIFRTIGNTHTYWELYPKGDATRGGYIGFYSGESDHIAIANEMTGGNIYFRPGAGGYVRTEGDLKATGTLSANILNVNSIDPTGHVTNIWTGGGKISTEGGNIEAVNQINANKYCIGGGTTKCLTAWPIGGGTSGGTSSPDFGTQTVSAGRLDVDSINPIDHATNIWTIGGNIDLGGGSIENALNIDADWIGVSTHLNMAGDITANNNQRENCEWQPSSTTWYDISSIGGTKPSMCDNHMFMAGIDFKTGDEKDELDMWRIYCCEL